MGRRIFSVLAPVAVAAAVVVATGSAAQPIVTVDPPIPATIQANTLGGANFTVTASVSDEDAGLLVNCTPNGFFPLGTTLGNCTAGPDTEGLTGSAPFSVTVVDTAPPQFSGVPSNYSIQLGSALGYTSPTATDVAYGARAVSCNPLSTFVPTQTGPVQVTCSASDGATPQNSADVSFTVTVNAPPNDAPQLNLPSNITAEATSSAGRVVDYTVTATDDGGPVTPSCNPTSGSTFPITTTTVNCSVSDGVNPTVTGSFTVTIRDTTPPTVTVDSVSVPATGPGGATGIAVTASATDAVSPTVTAVCPPAADYPIGTTNVTCEATDGAGNTGSGQGTVTVGSYVDNVDPIVTVNSVVVQATSPAGATVAVTATYTDNVDGGPFPADCPAATPYAVGGPYPVTCTAMDAAGNLGSGQGTITVVDEGFPVVTAPDDRVVEANGPDGSVVNYPAATAVDNVNGNLPVNCTPPSGSTFPIGTSSVSCAAADTAGNLTVATFTIIVQDTTPPTLTPPADTGIQSTVPVPATDPTVVEFLNSAVASDIADPEPVVTTTAPDMLPLGTTTITFIARDDAGNTATATSTITIGPDAAPSGNDRTPPGKVRDVKATTGNRTVSVAWKRPADLDFEKVEITRSPGKNGDATSVVFDGAGTKFLDRGLTVGTEYRYVIVALDEAGNRSAGVAVVALARETALLSPQEGAVLKKPPKLTWKKTKGAKYYNVQLFSSRKILSAWPAKTSYQFKKTWRWGGKVRKMRPGTYTVYVWPGFGKKSANRYGDLLFQTTFTIRR